MPLDGLSHPRLSGSTDHLNTLTSQIKVEIRAGRCLPPWSALQTAEFAGGSGCGRILWATALAGLIFRG